jgi:hypothetical protein
MAANGISTLATKELRQIAKLDIAQLKRRGYTLYADGTTNFGSIQFGAGKEVRLTTKTAFGFGTGDFTVEGFFNPTSLAGNVLFDFRTAASELSIYLNVNSSGNVRLYVNGAYVITTTLTISIGAWSHVAVSRFNGSTKVFINGTQSGVTYTDTNNYGTTKPLSIGSSYTSDSHFVGYISNIRIVKGTAVYTTAFTPSLSPLTAIDGTQLLLNTDYGANFLQDSSTNNFTLTNIGPVVTSNTGPGPDTNAVFYRTRNTYDITQLPTQYNNNAVVDNPNIIALTLTPGVIRSGVSKVTYSGYHNDDVTFTDTAAVTASEVATNFTIASIAENTTVLYTGYLLADYTGTWTFGMASDDASYLWIGNTAVTGYTTSNELVTASYNGSGTGTISLTAGEYYPIRLLYGNSPASGNLTLTYAYTGQTATSDFTGKLFRPDAQLIRGRPWATVEVYTGLTFTYGQATISFTLAGGIFYNVTCPYGAGGYPYGGAVDPVITMPGNQLTGGTTPANDIQWEYTAVGGVITGFTYRSGNPP